MRPPRGFSLKVTATKLMEFRSAKSGAVAMIFGLAFIPLMLALGASIDYARAARARAQLQEAGDAAAVAVAAHASLSQSAHQNIAQSVALANLSAIGWTATPNVTESEPSGNYQVTVTASLPTAFMRLAHINSVPLSTTSVAAYSSPSGGTTTTTTTAANVCVLALSKTATQAFLANSGAVINAPNCEVDVASTANPAAIFNSGASFTLNSFCIAGSSIINNGATFTNGSSVLKTSCTTASDPFAGKLPSVSVGSCTVSNQNYSGSVTLSPGVYCGSFNFNGSSGTVTLSPGLYVFKGVTWNLNSGWSMVGSGVTLYFADSSYLQFNGAAAVTLTAPTTGTYANILMFEASGLSASSFTINGSSASPDSLAGLIYLPSRNVTFNSGASVNAAAITMVVNTLIMDGVTWNLTASSFGISSASSTVTTTKTTSQPAFAHLIR